MGYPQFSVEYSGTLLDTNLTNSVVINSRDGLKTTVGVADFQIQNIDDDYTGKVKIDDSVDIYMGYATGSACIFSGFVNELSDQCDFKQRNMKVSCVNKMERLLSHLDSKDYPSGTGLSNQTASAILGNIITRINGDIQNDEPDITTTNVTTTIAVITPYAYNYRPVMEILRELSAPEKTGNGQFIYYIDKSNDLHFKPRPVTSATTPTIDEYNFTEFRATYSIFDVINAVIVNCGTDDNGASVLAMGVNFSSVTEVGFRWKYIVKNEIGDSYRNANLTNAEKRTKMRSDGESWAESYTKLLGEPRWKVIATMKGNYNYPGTTTQMITGEVVKMTSSSNWSGTKALRVMDIQQNFNFNGWMTGLKLEEDDKTKLII